MRIIFMGSPDFAVPTLDALDQLVDAEVLGPHPLQRRQAAAEDVIAPGEQPRAIERP